MPKTGMNSLPLLDPTKLDSQLNKSFCKYLNNSAQTTFLENTEIDLSPLGKFALVHEIRTRLSPLKHYEVLSRKLASDECSDKFELLGVLDVLQSGELAFDARCNYFVIDTLQHQTFDLANLKLAEKLFLASVFEAAIDAKHYVFYEGDNRVEIAQKHTGHKVIIYFNLRKDIYAIRSADDIFGWHFEMPGSFIGKGTFAEVVFAETFVINNKKLEKKSELKSSDNLRVIKRQRTLPVLQNIQTVEEVTKVYKLSKETPHQGLKPPTFFGQYAYNVGRYFPGKDLSQLIDELRQDPKILTTDERIACMRDILCRAKKQVFDRKIVHRDLKIDNIRVEKNVVNIIDFNLSKFASEDDRYDSVGAPLYIAPEVWAQQNTTNAADMFQLGTAFAYLFDATNLELEINDMLPDSFKDLEFQKKNAQAVAKKKIQLARRAASNRDYKNLFAHTPDLHPDHQVKIKKIILSVSKPDPSDRMSAEEAIRIVEEVMLERFFKLPGVITNDQAELYRQFNIAHVSANYLKDKMQTNMSCAYQIFGKQIEAALTWLPESLPVLQEFLKILDLDYLKDAKTKEEVNEKTATAIEAYDKCIHDLDQFRVNFEKYCNELAGQSAPHDKKIQRIKARLDHAIQKSDQHCLTLDDIVRITKKLRKDIARIENEYVELEMLIRDNARVVSTGSALFSRAHAVIVAEPKNPSTKLTNNL